VNVSRSPIGSIGLFVIASLIGDLLVTYRNTVFKNASSVFSRSNPNPSPSPTISTSITDVAVLCPSLLEGDEVGDIVVVETRVRARSGSVRALRNGAGGLR
jgi:hypothetical protein